MKAKSGHDNTVRAEIEGLKPDTSYKYRFCTQNGGAFGDGQVHDRAGSKNQNETIRFALSGDQDARPLPGGTTPYWNDFERLETRSSSNRTTSTCSWATRSTPTPRSRATRSPTSR